MRPKPFKYENLAPVTIQRQDLHEIAIRFAEEEFARKGCAPFMWIVAVATTLHWIETPWEDDREKERSTYALRESMRLAGAHAYSFITEAWAAHATVEEYESGNHVAPSDRPKSERDDILLITTFDRHGGFDLTRYLVTIRPPGRGLNFLGPRIDANDGNGHFDGRMWNLLAAKEGNPT